MKSPTLETPRLRLGNYRLAYAPILCSEDKTNHRVGRFDSLKKARYWIYHLWKRKDGYGFAITLKETGEFIGEIWLLHIDPRTDFKVGEIGYWMRKKFRRKGYMVEAAKRILEFGFNEKKLHKIKADTDNLNIASNKVLEKIGFKLEGRLRKQFYKNKKWSDEMHYGLLKEEWKR